VPLARRRSLPEELRQRACTELLRQAAHRAGLLDAADDPPPSTACHQRGRHRAIEALLERELRCPSPRRGLPPPPRRARRAPAHGERVQLRHVLFAVTPGVDVRAAQARRGLPARPALPRAGEADRFAEAARQTSNCPSGAEGGDLGWLARADCAPEFAREVFGHPEVGVLPRLVHSRFGLHVVEVLAREPGTQPSRRCVGRWRRRCASRVSPPRCASTCSCWPATEVEGVDLDAAATPLVQ
jgi:peptidyl-prolyl cis-trans isomerase C